MRTRFKRKVKLTAHAFVIGSAACMCIYGTLVLGAAKSMLKMQTTRVDM